MYNQCGLHLIRYKQENGTAIFKIQTKSSTLPTITKNDGSLVYEMYLLICANLITKRIDESFLQEPFSEEILSMIKSTNPKEEGALFHQIIKYFVGQGWLAMERDDVELHDTVLTKKSQPPLCLEPLNNQPIKPLYQLTAILLQNPVINIHDYKSLWNQIPLEELMNHIDTLTSSYYVNEDDDIDQNGTEYGYELLIQGDTARLVSKNDPKAFPKLTEKHHRVLVDILPRLQQGESLEVIAPQSKYYTETTKLDVLQKLIDEYQLLSLTVNIK